MRKKANFKVMKNAAKRSADIWLYDEIGAGGYFEGISSSAFAQELEQLGTLETLNAYINSPGGDVFEGVAIYNILNRHKARVITHIDGFAASIASVIAMAGNEVRMAENALMVLQNPQGFVIGNSKDIRKTARELETMRKSSFLSAYTKQSDMKEERILKLMDEETWMSAQEAKIYGLIDKIVDGKNIKASFDLSKFRFKKKAMVKHFQASRQRFHSSFRPSLLEIWKRRIETRQMA